MMDPKSAKEEAISRIQSNISLAKDNYKDEIDKSRALEERRENLAKKLDIFKSRYARAIPEMEKARAAMMEVRPESITEIRTFIWPGYPVKTVCKCMFVFLKGTYDVSWNSAKKLMASDSMLYRHLIQLDPELITGKQLRLAKHLLRHAENPNVPQMERMSTAAANLFTWVLGVIRYADIYRKLKPILRKIKKYEIDLARCIHDFEDSMQQIENHERSIRFFCEKRREVSKVKERSSQINEIRKLLDEDQLKFKFNQEDKTEFNQELDQL